MSIVQSSAGFILYPFIKDKIFDFSYLKLVVLMDVRVQSSPLILKIISLSIRCSFHGKESMGRDKLLKVEDSVSFRAINKIINYYIRFVIDKIRI